jgi:acetylornithine/N-succinyldiaminopimelate aminotransferase
MTNTAESVVQKTEAHFFPVFNRSALIVDRARGCTVWDLDGKEYIDLTSGWGVTCLGHCHPALLAAISEQLSLCMQPPNCNLSYTIPQAEAAELVVSIAPQGLTKVFFTSSGTEATEGALKLVRRAQKKPGIIACLNSFHGRTLGATSVTGQTRYRAPFEPLLPGVKFVEFGRGEAVAAAIDDATAAIIVEPIQGEGGVNVPPAGYLQDLREIANRHDILLIFDEIQTGMGRTGKLFAASYEGVTPDILLLGKCLGGGFPVGAILVTDDVAATIEKGDHGGTYAGNPLACAAVVAVIREFLEHPILDHCQEAGKVAMDFLRELQHTASGKITEVRGRGLLIACELATEEVASALAKRCLEHGVIVNVTHGKVLRLFPALNIDLPMLEDGLRIIGRIIMEL